MLRCYGRSLQVDLVGVGRTVPAAVSVRQLIREMSLANPLWGAPRIHGELRKLDIADRHPLRRSTPQHIELMSKDEDFGLQC